MRVSRRPVLYISVLYVVVVVTFSRASGQAPLAGVPDSQNAWADPARELVTKILARGAQGTVTLTVRNISDLSDEEVSKIRRELRAELRTHGVRLSTSKQSDFEIQVTLSENIEGFVWVAVVKRGTEMDTSIVAFPQPERGTGIHASETMSIQKVRLVEQKEPILDLVTFAPDATAAGAGAPMEALVLTLGSVSVYEREPNVNSRTPGAEVWHLKQSALITRAAPWPRDPRGRLVPGAANSFDAYLPGMKCSGAVAPVVTVSCHEGDEPWPMGDTGSIPEETANGRQDSQAGESAGRTPVPQLALAYFAAHRNFFDGRIGLKDGQVVREVSIAPFFSATPLPAGSGAAWLTIGIDGSAQLFNGSAQAVSNLEGMGSDIVGIHKPADCALGAGLVLASGTGRFDEPDQIQAFEIANRKASAAAAPVEFDGPITALWPLDGGFAAIAISHNLRRGTYEAFRLSVHCAQ